MIKILDNTKDLSLLVNDNSNGLGQIQPNSAFVDHELNGIFEAEITMLDTDKHFKDIEVNSILKINSGEIIGEQMFRVYYISKPINHLITLKCQHITYDLNKVPVKPFSATGAVNIKNGMLENVMGTYPFTMTTDITNTTAYFELDRPRSFRECLGGWNGSILDTLQCEYDFDNLNVGMMAHLGSDNGVRIAYGKNLTDLTQEENIENVFTGVLGYAIVDEITYTGEIYNKVQATYPKIKIVDFSSEYDSETLPTTEDLTLKAQDYATRNAIEVPNVSIDIKFVPLYQTEEYKNIAPLERVGLGDTVHVYFEKLGIEANSRVIKTRWNVLLNKYESVELGSTRANLNTVLNETIEQTKEEIMNELDLEFDTGAIENELNQMAGLIINGLGLHYTKQSVAGGGYRFYLHNKPTLAESNVQYILTSEGFLVSTDYGQTWNAGFDSEGNAVLNSLSTIILKALEIYGSYLCFGDYPDGKYIEASTYSNSSSVPQGVSFDGSGTIRLQPQEAFYVNNINSNGELYNSIQLYVTDNKNYIRLRNYDNIYKTELANAINLNSNVPQYNEYTQNNILSIYNYRTFSGTSNEGNSIYMQASYSTNDNTTSSNLQISNKGQQSNGAGGNYIYLLANSYYSISRYTNKQYGSSNDANKIEMSSSVVDTNNYLKLENYSIYNGTNSIMSNSITLSSVSGGQNTLNINNYDVDGKFTNGINLYSQLGTSNSSVTLSNGRYDISSTSYYTRNTFTMISNTTSGTYIMMSNTGSDGVVVNSIKLDSTNGQLILFSNSDIRINSNGAVRLTSGSSQDITLTSADDINISATDKFYITIGGTQKEVYFSGNYLMIR